MRTPEQVAWDILTFCCADPHRVPADVVAAHLELGRRREAYTEMDAEFVAATRSLLRLLRGHRRRAGTLSRIGGPVLLLHGEAAGWSPVAARRGSPRPNPAWRFEPVPEGGARADARGPRIGCSSARRLAPRGPAERERSTARISPPERATRSTHVNSPRGRPRWRCAPTS